LAKGGDAHIYKDAQSADPHETLSALNTSCWEREGRSVGNIAIVGKRQSQEKLRADRSNERQARKYAVLMPTQCMSRKQNIQKYLLRKKGKRGKIQGKSILEEELFVPLGKKTNDKKTEQNRREQGEFPKHNLYLRNDGGTNVAHHQAAYFRQKEKGAVPKAHGRPASGGNLQKKRKLSQGGGASIAVNCVEPEIGPPEKKKLKLPNKKA